MITNNILTLINESYIFSNKTISVDLDKFESGEFNKLLISGLSGSGKTSTAIELSKKYNVEFFDTDSLNKLINEKYPKSEYDSNFRFGIFLDKFKKKLLDNNKRIICGGAISRSYIKSNELKPLLLKFPFIFLGKSALLSSYDSYVRNKKDENGFDLSDSLRWNFKIYYKGEMQLRKDRINIPKSNIEEFGFDYKK